MVRITEIVKKPRGDPIPDHPINFPALHNLHLELLENKRKIKPGLPLIPITADKPPPQPPKVTQPPSKTTIPEQKPKHGQEGKSKTKNERPSKTEKPPKRGKPPPEAPKDDTPDAELIAALGAEDDETLDERELSEPGSKPGSDDEESEGEEEKAEDENDPYAGLTPEERIAKETQEYIWRFHILRKQYKTADIPMYNEHSDLATMKSHYERLVRELYLDDSVETYRTYLVGSWVVIEFVSVQFIGIDLTGFTRQQVLMMTKYDRMLIELGERSYNRWASNLPIEIRLIGFTLLQAGIFYLGKVITDRMGITVGELFKGITGQPADPVPAEQEQKKGRRMKGPSIKVEDIK